MTDEKKPPMSPDEAAETIRQCAKEGRVSFAETDVVESLEPWIDEILAAIGVKAWVSDRSCFSDFYSRERNTDPDYPFKDRQMVWPENVERLQEELGLPLDRSDYIVDVARKLKELRKCDPS
jgi:hypothetical protein